MTMDELGFYIFMQEQQEKQRKEHSENRPKEKYDFTGEATFSKDDSNEGEIST